MDPALRARGDGIDGGSDRTGSFRTADAKVVFVGAGGHRCPGHGVERRGAFDPPDVT